MSFVQFLIPGITPGPGPGVDVSALGKNKTILLSGAWTGLLIPEASHDNSTYAPLQTFNGPDVKVIPITAQYMRIRGVGKGYNAAAAVGYVGAPDAVTQTAEIPIPSANGAGAELDVSAMGSFKTIILGGANPIEGTLTVQARGPTGGFVPLFTFDGGGIKTIRDIVASALRVYARGFTGTIPPALRMDVGAQDD